MKFARPRKRAVLQYLSDEQQAAYDADRWGDRPDATLSICGNDQRCRSCGAPPGKKCIRADGSFRDHPHQKRRDDAMRLERFKPIPQKQEATKP
jgi:hypothetical protein